MHVLLGAILCVSVAVAQQPRPKPNAGRNAKPTPANQAPGAPAVSRPAVSQPAVGQRAASQSAASQPAATKPASPDAAKPGRVGLVEFDSNGYPVIAEEPADTRRAPPPVAPPAAPLAESRPAAPVVTVRPFDPSVRLPGPSATEANSARTGGQQLASGMDRGSPLLDVFQSVRTPGSFKALGGVTVWWRVTIYDQQGGILGYREITQTADCAYPDRDRLDYVDNGRIERAYGRSGAAVFAEREGRPWPTLAAMAGQDLALFGMQLRLPWCFGDGGAYVVVARDTVDRPHERQHRAVIERRPQAAQDVVGPELDPAPRDRFELLYEPSSGRPRELVHRFASGNSPGESRRVLLDDWAEYQGLPYPRRRLYVDDNRRPTAMLEIQRLEACTTSERDFRIR